jgi:hypothetical protein
LLHSHQHVLLWSCQALRRSFFEILKGSGMSKARHANLWMAIFVHRLLFLAQIVLARPNVPSQVRGQIAPYITLYRLKKLCAACGTCWETSLSWVFIPCFVIFVPFVLDFRRPLRKSLISMIISDNYEPLFGQNEQDFGEGEKRFLLSSQSCSSCPPLLCQVQSHPVAPGRTQSNRSNCPDYAIRRRNKRA